MEKTSQEKLNNILEKYNQTTIDVSKQILEELKNKNQTYGEVIKQLSRFKQATIYQCENLEAYGHLFNRISELLEKEMNDLPLTNRSRL